MNGEFFLNEMDAWDADPRVREWVSTFNRLAAEVMKLKHPTYTLHCDGDAVDHPPHYNQVPGIECIEVVQHFDYNVGAAMKYLWRYKDKNDPIQDLKKAIRYIQYEIARLEASQGEMQALQEGSATD